jgi:hypothetical protein
MMPTESPTLVVILSGDRASLQDITVQRFILILLGFAYMLSLVSKTVFVSMYTPLVAIRFGASAQLVSGELLSCHGGGKADEAS